MKRYEFEKIVKDIYNEWEGNNFRTLGEPDQSIWEHPTVGVAAGDDLYFDFLKEHIGEFHWSPLEFFNLKYKNSVEENKANAAQAENLRVVSLSFPQSMGTKDAQANEKKFPSEKWIVSRGEWEPIIKIFSAKLLDTLKKQGVRAVSTDLQPEFSWEDSKKLGKASSFSHRHAAFAAGLGTFGLSEGLITERGKAVRFTTLVVEAPLEVTERTYKSHNEWCLYYKNGSCGLCIDRCPVGAITKEGHNKVICQNYEDVLEKEGLPYDLDTSNYIFGCGICQTKIPCQNKRP